MGLASKISKLASKGDKKSPSKSKKAAKESSSVPISPAEYGPTTVLPKQESSKNFERKFKGTKVVDKNNKPTLLYHGRTNDYEAFDTKQGGSSSVQELGTHLGTQAQANDFATYYGGNVVPAYADIKNPLRLEDRGGFQPIEVLEQLRGYGVSDELANQIEDLPVPEQAKAVTALIKGMGHDGIVYLNKREGLNLKGSDQEVARKLDEIQDYDDEILRTEYGAEDSYIILDPTQAKSPFNKGTYSETDDRFNYNKGGSVKTKMAMGGSVESPVSVPVQPAETPATLVVPKFGMAKGGKVAKQTQRMLKEGGMMQEGGTVDPVSGNDVPVGAMQEEVRDDIPAQLSEGEFVFPADVVRYIGLERLMMMRQAAKEGLGKMEDMGQMSNADEATMEDDGAFESQIDEIMGELGEGGDAVEMAVGGMATDPAAMAQTQQALAQDQQPQNAALTEDQLNAINITAKGMKAQQMEVPLEKQSKPTEGLTSADIIRQDASLNKDPAKVDSFLQKIDRLAAAKKALILRHNDTVTVGFLKPNGAIDPLVFTKDTPDRVAEAAEAMLSTAKQAGIKRIESNANADTNIAIFNKLGYPAKKEDLKTGIAWSLDL